MSDTRMPPQDLDAEQAVLGAMMLEPSCIDEVAAVLQASEQIFCRSDHISIYNALVRMNSDGEAIDLITLREYLRSVKQFEKVGGQNYLLDLVQSIPSAANVLYYAKIVRAKADLRRLISLGSKLVVDSYHPEADADALLREAETELLRMRGGLSQHESRTAEEIGRQVIDDILEGREKEGLRTGFDRLDGRLMGLRPGQYLTLAARPSLGKTAMAVQIACHVAIKEKVSVCFFTLEMGGKALVRRMLAQQLGIYGNRLRKPDQLSPMDRSALKTARLPDNLHIVEAPGMSGADLRAQTRRMKMRHGVGLVVLDYLGLMYDPQGGRQNKAVEIANLSRDVKACSREMEVPILCLHAMSRSSQHENRAPQLHDLRDSSAVEHDSDIVMFLHPITKIDANHRVPIEIETMLLIRKNREGDLGNLRMRFIRPLTTFIEGGREEAQPTLMQEEPADVR